MLFGSLGISGRREKLDQYKPEIEALLANGATQKFIAQRYDSTEATVSRWVKKQGLQEVY